MPIPAHISNHEIIILFMLAEEKGSVMDLMDLGRKIGGTYHATPGDYFTRLPSMLVGHIMRSLDNLAAYGLIETVTDENAPVQIFNDHNTNKSIASPVMKGYALTQEGQNAVHLLLNPRPQRARSFKIV